MINQIWNSKRGKRKQVTSIEKDYIICKTLSGISGVPIMTSEDRNCAPKVCDFFIYM